jgi:serine/threonine protein kinase
VFWRHERHQSEEEWRAGQGNQRVRNKSPNFLPDKLLKKLTINSLPRTHLAEVDVDPISGRKIINHYEIISELGRGVHGKVKQGRDLDTNQLVAIKIVERVSKIRRLGRTGDQETKIKREIAILKKARHPNIVGLLEVIDDPAKKKVYIVLELAELGEVVWRTRGKDEICLIEYRRHQREEIGVFENDAANQEDQHILESAHRQLERRERREFEEYQRRAAHQSDDIRFWSLEHGGESDQEDDYYSVGTRSRTSPRAARFMLGNEPDIEMQRNTAADGTRIKAQAARETSFDRPREETHRTALEGTMYGAYDEESIHDREPSLLHSFASNEDFQRELFPEHFHYVPTMTLSEARQTLRDTVLGLEYLHYQGVVHRDIKPANLLQWKDHRIKISDFGVSYLGKVATDDEQTTKHDGHGFDEALELAKTVGTPAFYAPELCQTDVEGETPPVTNQIDVWALGVTLYCLVYGRVPFHDNNTFVLMRLIAERDAYLPRRRLKAVENDDQPYQAPSPGRLPKMVLNCNKRLPHELAYEAVDDDLHDLLKRLLEKDPRKRIKLIDVKHHPWVIAGMDNPTKWFEESDPSKITHGRKIEVSKDDLEVAVAPYKVTDQILSLAKRIGGVLGLRKSVSRRRSKSNAEETATPSNASSSSTISQDANRHRGSNNIKGVWPRG